MRAYRSARRDHFIHILIVAGAISVLLVTTVLVFFLSSS